MKDAQSSEIKELRHKVQEHEQAFLDLYAIIDKLDDNLTKSIVDLNKRLGRTMRRQEKDRDDVSEHIVNIYHSIAEIFDKLLPVFYRMFPNIRDTERQIEQILKKRKPPEG